MTKERRLGRGLEALLGQLPVRNEPALPAQQHRPAAGTSRLGRRPRTAPAPAAPAGALGGGDVPARFGRTPSPGQAAPQPHHPPAQQPQPAAGRGRRHGTPPPASGRGSASSRSTAIRPSRGRTSTRTKCDRWPKASRPTACSQPVVVRRVSDRYQLVAGERRLRAAIQAGWTDVPVNVVEADDRQMAELAIVENLQRKDLNPLEKAASFQRYLDQYGCTQEELAGRLKLDRSTIANLIRLLELPEAVQEAIRRGTDHPGPRPRPACRWATSASRSTSASGFSARG